MYYESNSDSDEALPPVVASSSSRRRAAAKTGVDNSRVVGWVKLTGEESEPNREEDELFPCSQCGKEFTTPKALISHKVKAEDHEYCKEHDLDFETWEDYGIHRVTSPDHRTCKHCFQDFKSKAGLEIHMSQFHKNTKAAVCPYCDKVFDGGIAGLSLHIESNQCKGGMTRKEMSGRVSAIKAGKLPVPHENWNDLSQPILQPTEPITTVDDATKKLRTLGIYDKMDGNNLGIAREDVKNYYSTLFRKYACPCGKKFNNAHSMWQHLQSIAHQQKSFRCVGCEKTYRSTSALMQHQQSGARACKLAENDALAAADRATGGLASAARQAASD